MSVELVEKINLLEARINELETKELNRVARLNVGVSGVKADAGNLTVDQHASILGLLGVSGAANSGANITVYENGSNPGLRLLHGGTNLFATIQGPDNRSLRFKIIDNTDGDSFQFVDINNAILLELFRTGKVDKIWAGGGAQPTDGEIAASSFNGFALTTLADDTAQFVTPTGPIGTLVIFNRGTTNDATISGLVEYCTVTTARCTKIAGGSQLATTTGVLTGTTGADGFVTVSASTNGNIYIENRRGSNRAMGVVFLAV